MNRPYLGAYSKTRFLRETGFLGTIAQGVLTVGIAPELIWVCFPTPTNHSLAECFGTANHFHNLLSDRRLTRFVVGQGKGFHQIAGIIAGIIHRSHPRC